jgi:hypothetical protein
MVFPYLKGFLIIKCGSSIFICGSIVVFLYSVFGSIPYIFFKKKTRNQECEI